MTSLVEVTKMLTVLSAHYPNGPALTEANFKAYHKALEDLPADLLEAAVRQVGVTNKFFPSVAELRKAALALAERAEGVPTAFEAWLEVSRVTCSHRYYDDGFEWSHELVGRTVAALGGVGALKSSKNVAVDRAHFLRIYEALQEHDREMRMLLPGVRRAVAAKSQPWGALGAGDKMLEGGES